MKKLILISIIIILIILGFISYMTFNDKHISKKISYQIVKNTEIKDIEYLNQYNNYYIVMDDNYLYVLNQEYYIIIELDKFLLHDNPSNYQIIYKDNQVMYMNDKYKDHELVYEYYDIYTYELIDKITIGGA